MKGIIGCFLFCACISIRSLAQDALVVTSDIDRFWTAFDSCQTTSDTVKQAAFIQAIYVDKGSAGLLAFMRLRDFTPKLWVRLINGYPEFWNSIRPNTNALKTIVPKIEESINKLKELYPPLKDSRMYFTIGGLRTGGTTDGNMILIGAEIATGNASTVPPNPWLASVFKEQRTDNIIVLNVHEYIHTQQRGEPQDLLGSAINEGICDFIAELVTGRPLQTNYMKYGRSHEVELKKKFKAEMYGTNREDWMYNGNNAKLVADLGYFMGYAIARSYYRHANDKKIAIRSMIELNFSDTSAVHEFMKAAKYF
jgi:hypothetical protein